MDELKRRRLVRDNADRDLVSVPHGPNDREWLWAATDGTPVAQVGILTAIGDKRYEFTGTALDTQAYSGSKGTEADLLAEIGTGLGWNIPVQPVEMSGSVSLKR